MFLFFPHIFNSHFISLVFVLCLLILGHGGGTSCFVILDREVCFRGFLSGNPVQAEVEWVLSLGGPWLSPAWAIFYFNFLAGGADHTSTVQSELQTCLRGASGYQSRGGFFQPHRDPGRGRQVS